MSSNSTAETVSTADPGHSALFALEDRKDYGVVHLPQFIDHKAAKELAELTEKWLAEPFKVLILDLERVKKLEPAVFRPLVLLHQGLKKKGGGLFTINVSHEILQIIQNAGLDSVFSPRMSLAGSVVLGGDEVPKGVIDVGFINPFIDATQSTIKAEARTELRAGRPFLKNGRLDNEMEIAGVISM